MEIRARDDAEPFVTTDGSTIRSLLDRSNAPVANQSLAEATIGAGESTTRHRHRVSEEIYYLIEGTGEMELDGEVRTVGPGDAILIHTGWGTLWNVDNARYVKTSPGLGVAAAEWLAAQDPLLVGSDNWPVEVAPNPDPDLSLPVHQHLTTEQLETVVDAVRRVLEA